MPLAGLGHSVAWGPIAVVPSDITGEMSPNMLPPGSSMLPKRPTAGMSSAGISEMVP